MNTPTDADRIAAQGRMIPLSDGTTAHLRYSLRSLALLESRFGSMTGLTDALSDVETGDKPVLASILDIVGAGLIGSGWVPHARERIVPTRTTYPDGRVVARDERETVDVTYVRQADKRELGDLLEMRDLEKVAALMGEALAEAMPAGEAPAPVGAPTPPLTLPTLGFPGPISSTSRPSLSDVVTGRSGG